MTNGEIPARMKAGVLHAVGDIRCDDVHVPTPGPGEVLVRVRACGVCGSDIPRVFETGMYHMPDIPGHEFAGEVASLGSGVTGVAVGQRAAIIPLIQCRVCPACLIGEYSQCENYDYLGSRSPGGFAEYVKAPAANLVSLPPEVDFEGGALVEVAAVALHALRRTRGFKGGERVVVFGAGAVGLLAAQWARVLGAGAVCAVDVVDEKLAMARSLGVDLTLNSKNTDVATALSDWTHGEGVQLAVEASGANAALDQAITSLAKGGQLALVGRQERGVTLAVRTYEAILRRQLDIFGCWAWSRLPKREWADVLEFAARGHIELSPLVSHRYQIDDVREALEMMRDKTEVYEKVLFVFP